jgi:hypothetical protein
MYRSVDGTVPLTGPINLGNPNKVTMIELATFVLSLTGRRSAIQH